MCVLALESSCGVCGVVFGLGLILGDVSHSLFFLRTAVRPWSSGGVRLLRRATLILEGLFWFKRGVLAHFFFLPLPGFEVSDHEGLLSDDLLQRVKEVMDRANQVLQDSEIAVAAKRNTEAQACNYERKTVGPCPATDGSCSP